MFQSCILCFRPAPRISWVRVGGALPVGRYRMEAEDTELVLSNIQDEDEGEYQCTATNTAGTSTPIKVRLEVQCKCTNFIFSFGAKYWVARSKINYQPGVSLWLSASVLGLSAWVLGLSASVLGLGTTDLWFESHQVQAESYFSALTAGTGLKSPVK